MFKKDKTIKSDKSIERKLYAKAFLMASGYGFATAVMDVKSTAAILIGSAALNNGDLAKGEFKSTLKTAGLVTIGNGVLCGIIAGVTNMKYLKDEIAAEPEDASAFDVVFDLKED